ncbi:hypothetical protein ACFHYQ_28730 [Sphaerimonospora cavernae]|uniref:DUF4064 domain-containing protein n=1 Tax=Sphaerimonospora cavernae TaxID=1740611 RepID=A0ABV6UDS7_9ACTN
MNTPPGPPPPPGPPGPPGWPPPPPAGSSIGVVIGLTFVGIAMFAVINVAGFLFTLGVANAMRDNELLIVGIGAVLLAAIAIGGGILLILLRRPWSKGLGLGLMIGWALMSIISAGFCTGVNPSIYTDGMF